MSLGGLDSVRKLLDVECLATDDHNAIQMIYLECYSLKELRAAKINYSKAKSYIFKISLMVFRTR